MTENQLLKRIAQECEKAAYNEWSENEDISLRDTYEKHILKVIQEAEERGLEQASVQTNCKGELNIAWMEVAAHIDMKIRALLPANNKRRINNAL